jgi:hypothetical protein
MSAYDTRTEDCIATPPRDASEIDVDGEGATHHLGLRSAHEGLPVFVGDTTGAVEVYDLAETPCWGCADPVEAWIDHVAEKRGKWETETYDEGLVETLAASVEGA